MKARTLTTIIAAALILVPAQRALAAAEAFTGSKPLYLDHFILLESPRAERGHLDLGPGTPGARPYSGGFLPAELQASPKMYTFRTDFRVGQGLRGEDLSLYVGLSEYPFRIYLNGVEIFMKGRYSGGHYNSSLRAVNAVYLSPDLLRYGDGDNTLILEAYPAYENWGLDKLYVDRSTAVARDVFLRNFVGINLIQGAFVLAFIIGLYFLALFVAERRKQGKYLVFGLLCFAFCLSYFSVAIHYEANDEALLEALSKGGLVIMSSLMLVFCCEFTGVFNRKRIFPLVSMALGLGAAALVFLQRSKASILGTFGYAMNFIIVPQLLCDIVILSIALFRRRNRYVIPLLSSFAVIIATAANDVYYLNKAVLPYAWLTAYGYVAVVVAIFATLAKEQGDLYQKSLQQTADLIVNQRRIEILNEELTRQKDSFFRFVPTQFIELLGRDSPVDIRLGDSSLRYLSILFSDIRRFTAISEGMHPGENFEFLNNYLFRMERSIKQNSGFVDKYIGDAIMALFAFRQEDARRGKSLSADSSLIAALDMRRELGDFNRHLASTGNPAVEIGIGVNTGEVMMGTVGSENRLDTTVIGDSVNLSSRLESLTKFYRTPTLVSEQTVNAVVDSTRFAFRLVDHVSVQGRTGSLMVYELLDPEDSADREKISYADSLGMAMSLYLAMQFDEAGRAFARIHEEHSEDHLPRLFAERCAAYAEDPPASGWDGVFRFTRKEMA